MHISDCQEIPASEIRAITADPARAGPDACSCSRSNPAARHRGSAGTDPMAVASLLLALQRLPWNVLEGLSKQPWGISLLLSVSCICHLFSRICSTAMLSLCLLCGQGAPTWCLQPCKPIRNLGTVTSSSAPPPPLLVRPPLSTDPAFNWGPHFMQVSGSRTSDLTKFNFPTQTYRQKHRSCHERGSVPLAHGGRRWWI